MIWIITLRYDVDDDLDHHAVIAKATIIGPGIPPRSKLYWFIRVPDQQDHDDLSDAMTMTMPMKMKITMTMKMEMTMKIKMKRR